MKWKWPPHLPEGFTWTVDPFKSVLPVATETTGQYVSELVGDVSIFRVKLTFWNLLIPLDVRIHLLLSQQQPVFSSVLFM